MDKLEAVLENAGINDRLTIIKVRYALELVKNEVIKLIIFIVLFALIGHLAELFIAVALLFPIRIFSGGMHMKSNMSCFFYSLCFLVVSILLLPHMAISTLFLFSILLIAIAIIGILSPVESHKRPIRLQEKKASMKKKTVIFLGIDFCLLIALWQLDVKIFFVVGVWVISLQAIQLCVTWAYRKLKGRS